MSGLFLRSTLELRKKMLEAYGDIWDHLSEYDAVVITTNGYVKGNGEAVMGRGIALEATRRFPGIARSLGDVLKQYGNRVFAFSHLFDKWVFTFPVKPAVGPNFEPGWRMKADPELIETSARQIVEMLDDPTNNGHINKVLMPRPGCGNGGLKWEQVKPILEEILDDRFTVMERL